MYLALCVCVRTFNFYYSANFSYITVLSTIVIRSSSNLIRKIASSVSRQALSLPCSFHLVWGPPGSAMLWQMSGFLSFFLLLCINGTSHCIYIYIHIHTHSACLSLIGHWGCLHGLAVVSHGATHREHQCDLVVPFPLVICAEVGLLDRVVALFFLRSLCTVFHTGCTGSQPQQLCTRFPSLHVCAGARHLSSLRHPRHPGGSQVVAHSGSPWHSPQDSDAGPLLIDLLAVRMSSLETSV